MSNDVWRWADPEGQQRRVRLDELRAALAGGHIAPNTPVWKPGWANWQSAHEVPELTSASLGGAHGVVLNIPPPPLAMVAVQQSYEKQSESIAPSKAPTEAEEEPPVPPPFFVPVQAKMPSIHPQSSNLNIATQMGGSSGLVLAAPPVPNLSGSGENPVFSGMPSSGMPATPPGIPTTMGMPAAPMPMPMPSAEELSDSNLVDNASEPSLRSRVKTGNRLTPDPNVQPPPSSPDLRSPLFLHDKPPNVIDHLVADLKAIKSGQSPKNVPVLVAAAGMALIVVIGLLALVISIAGGGSGSTKTTASASASASAKQAPPPTTIASAITTVAPPPTEPPVVAPLPTASSVVLGECKVSGDTKLISPKAFAATAIEGQALNSGLALGFAATPRDAVATLLDASTLAPTSTTRTKPASDVKRVTPFLNGTKLSALVDADHKGDKIGTRRSVATSPLVDVGVADGAVVWAPHGRDSSAKLFALDGDAPVEALRAIPLADKHGVAVTFRRDNAIRIGVARGEQTLEADGELSKIDGLGQGAMVLGSPSITASGDRIVVAWGDRSATDADWTVRWTTVKPHETKHEATALAVPAGGPGGNVMSPSVASLGGGRFLLAWTEGTTTTHQVRALTFAADGTPSSTPLMISTAGDNAGQPAIAINDDGKGMVAYLAAKKGGFDLKVTPISCPKQP